MGSKNKKKKNGSNPSAEKGSKVSDGGDHGGKQLITDKRFSSVHWDPRFQPLSRHKTKVELDPRFQSMFSDKSFSSSAAPLDKRGKLKKQKTQNPLHRYYRIEQNKDKEKEIDKEDKEVEEADTESEEEELERVGTALKTAQVNDESEESEPASPSEVETADTESTTDTDEDDEEVAYEEEEVEAQEESIPNIDKETHRLAIVNLDWRHVKAVDLFVVLSSFLPNNGRILSVAVYPSEFGLQRMKEEEVHGPVGLFDGENDDDEKEHEENDEDDIDIEKLRAYEKSRMRYFYAVVECDSSSTADYLYNACDGTEFERSSNVLDLRFIPDSMEFKHPPRDVATEAPANYDGLDFQTRCLQQSNIELTWDEDEPERVKTLKRKFDADQLADLELKEYLASDESDSGDENENKDANDDEADKKDKKRDRYLRLLGDGDGSDEGEEKQDLEVTFNPGLEGLSKRILEKKEIQSETVFEAFLRKKREKKKMRKNNKSKSSSDEEEAEGDDDFFIEEAPPVKKSKNDRLGTENENREAADGEREATAGELELLFADEMGAADTTGPKGYNLKPKKANKGKKKRGKEKNPEDEDDELSKLPTFDDVDPRFADLFNNAEFALDPTDPNYKRSAHYLRQAAQRQHNRDNNNNNEPPPDKQPMIKEEATSSREKRELSSLVKSLKMKSKQISLPKKGEAGSMTRDEKRSREEEKTRL